MKLRLVTATLAVLVLTFTVAASASADPAPAVPVPNVTGPIAVTPGSHPYLATNIDLEKYGYVEQEFFIDGDAFAYDISGPADQDATRIETGGPNPDGSYPFETRIVVRRPANPADANGTVVAEWNNVTAQSDIEWNWFGDPNYMLRNGYTFVGVTAQRVGADGLKDFNPTRYGGINVDHNGAFPGGFNSDADPLAYDIYAAALNAITGNRASGPDPLGGITAETVIASGESQSCGKLSVHYNKIEPLQNLIDAYLLTVCVSPLREDRTEKAIRIITETENRAQRSEASYPDSSSIRHWEVAGGSHVPRLAWENIGALLNRDYDTITVGCKKFPLSVVQWPFTVNRAIKGLVDWVDGGAAPPIAPRGQYDVDGKLIRDQYGIAQGGIRYPEMTVPTGVNDADNLPGTGGSPLFSAFCPLLGSNTLFDRATLASLYTDYSDYVRQYSAAVNQFLATDFILPEDAARLKLISHQFPELRPTVPRKAGSRVNRGRFNLNWVGTEAPDTSFQLQRQSSRRGAGWVRVNARVKGRVGQLRNEPQGTFAYRVRSRTIIPANNIAEARTTTTPFSRSSVRVKVDRSGPLSPRIVIQGRRIARNTFRGPVRVRIIGRADGRLPDGSPGVGLNRRSIPRTRVIRSRGRVVVRAQTRDGLGNRSRPARLLIRIR